MCFVICIQVCVGVFCQLRIPDPSPQDSLHRARHWSSYNCYRFFFLICFLGKMVEKSITAFCYMKMPVEEESCQSSVMKPSSSPVSSMDTWRWRPSWAVAVLRDNFLFIRWMMIYFNLLSQCKKCKSLSDIYINDPCIACQKTRLIRNAWSLWDS